MPASSTIYLWLTKNETFSEMYTRAREDQADTLADEILDIADEDPASVFEDSKDGVDVLRVDSAAVAHQRLRVDARKWIAAKLKPRKYGDFSRQEHTGADGKPLLPARMEIVLVKAHGAG